MSSGTQTEAVRFQDKRLQQVNRVVQSPVLQGSEALCSLLKYLAERSIASPEVPIKEYQIATEVFGRSATFDPRLDSAVRVQLSRLRAKLSEYYNTVGRDDRILVEIPKGGHTVVFTEKASAPAAPEVRPQAEKKPTATPDRIGPPYRTWVIATMLALVALTMIFVIVRFSGFWGKEVGRTTVDKSAKGPTPAGDFWRGFLQSNDEPMVVFSNAEFVGRPETGLRYFDPLRDHEDTVFDHYTGVGEVLSVHQLDEMFYQLGRRVRVKRGRLLNWDDAMGRDVVFLGSPTENLSLRELPLEREFRFQTMTTPPRAGDLGIVNTHPAPGEQAVYFGTKGLPIVEDYALVELAATSGPARSILVLAGTTTFGTQAAVEFLCDDSHMRMLMPRVSVAGGHLAPFSALLHVKVQRGVPVETTLVAVRKAAP